MVKNCYLKFIKPLLSVNLHPAIEVQDDKARFIARRCLHPRWPAKLLKRWLIFKFLGFRSRELGNINPSHQKILWISIAAPSLGDVLQDISASVLLGNRSIFLFTSNIAADLLATDQRFSGLTSQEESVSIWLEYIKFDLVILDSFSSRTLIVKHRLVPDVPFVSVYRFVNGFEVHRLRFAFSRLSFLLSRAPGRGFRLLPDLCLKDLPYTIENRILEKYLVISVGGNWKFRDYKFWGQVVTEIMPRIPGLQIVLVGSENGLPMANSILKTNPKVRSLVGQQSITEAARTIQRASYFVGVDGGLWHIANCLKTPSTVLFARCDLFDKTGRRVMRDTEDMQVNWLHDEYDVSKISPALVVEEIIAGVRDINSGDCT